MYLVTVFYIDVCICLPFYDDLRTAVRSTQITRGEMVQTVGLLYKFFKKCLQHIMFINLQQYYAKAYRVLCDVSCVSVVHCVCPVGRLSDRY